MFHKKAVFDALAKKDRDVFFMELSRRVDELECKVLGKSSFLEQPKPSLEDKINGIEAKQRYDRETILCIMEHLGIQRGMRKIKE